MTRSHHSTLTELNITPLLDLVFVLLVIFIITTPQLVNTLEMSLPSAKPTQAKPAGKKEVQRIVVNTQGEISLNDEALSLEALRERLSRLRASDSDLGVVVKGADDADYQSVINVLDLLRQLDISKVGLATDAANRN